MNMRRLGCVFWVLLLQPWAAASQTYWLKVYEAADNTPFVTLPLSDSGNWCLHWNHSVAGFPVEDCFRVEAGQLLLHYSRQPDFAAGLDHIPGRGSLETDPQGGYLISNIDEPINNNELWLRLGSLAVDHRIISANQVFNLSRVAAGKRVRIRLEETP
ncbi:MAG: DUF1850 domain-containing protein [Natronospirillum sp.]